jgi:hypothetical protein
MFVRTGASGSSNTVTQVRIPICLLDRELQEAVILLHRSGFQYVRSNKHIGILTCVTELLLPEAPVLTNILES